MPRTIRFHLDEHVAHAVARGLQRRGIDVTTSTDAGLLGRADPDQMLYASAQGRVLFTQDDDFLALAAAGLRHSGLVYCQQHSRSIGQIVRGLELIWQVCEPGEMRDRVEFL